MRRVFVVLALAGCDKVLGLTENPILDAPPAIGHNEDGDAFADADDNCPTVEGSQQDSDMDGVGDLCDPNPDVANSIGAFYAFDVMPAAFVPFSGSWSVANDTLVHKGTSDYAKFVARNGPELAPPYLVEARFRFDTIPPLGEFSVAAAWDANAVQGSFCSLINAPVMTEVHAYSPGGSGVTRVAPLDFTATFTARLIVEPTSVTCIISSSTQGDTAATGTTPSVATGVIGLEGRHADTTTDYVIVYTR